jgi:hypothetical protein
MGEFFRKPEQYPSGNVEPKAGAAILPREQDLALVRQSAHEVDLGRVALEECLARMGLDGEEVAESVGSPQSTIKGLLGDEIITDQDRAEAESFLQARTDFIKLQTDEILRKNNFRRVDEISKLPSFTDIGALCRRLLITPYIDGTIAFVKEGDGRVRGTNRDSQSAYYTFVDSDYGSFYAPVGQYPKGNGQTNVRIQVRMGINFSTKPGNAMRSSVASTSTSLVTRDDFSDRSHLVSWDELLVINSLKDDDLKKILEDFSNYVPPYGVPKLQFKDGPRVLEVYEVATLFRKRLLAWLDQKVRSASSPLRIGG